jgi:hypothetical protein
MVVGSQATRVLINDASVLTSTLKKMGLDISNMLSPSKVLFYGIIPGNLATPIGSVTLPGTFKTKDNYCTEYVKFEVANFKSSYHAILGRPTLVKFMVVPHYLLKMPGKIEVFTFHGNLKKSYDCDQEAIKYVLTTCVPAASAEVFMTVQQLP